MVVEVELTSSRERGRRKRVLEFCSTRVRSLRERGEKKIPRQSLPLSKIRQFDNDVLQRGERSVGVLRKGVVILQSPKQESAVSRIPVRPRTASQPGRVTHTIGTPLTGARGLAAGSRADLLLLNMQRTNCQRSINVWWRSPLLRRPIRKWTVPQALVPSSSRLAAWRRHGVRLPGR